ncbi:hypothetical protein H257_16004 [Aphanomyces astaci]|uniref:Uncharacterized protein n=1 Tax=Aphanomyces astaci TaxID=112090 RepID=W4FM29_APHAT|nr:hypothetical protein H257_16004 [Aphanomyces astaci]ETV67879.1 hypothetical protein H257_16004 [Aphanomyces astaci]|eukprot:XP_009842624.1 hypothetical protein H257_16004 [Aphanomyces astaci]
MTPLPAFKILRNVADDEREGILREVLLLSNGSYMSTLSKGQSQHLADKYNCHVSTIHRVLALAKQQGVGHGNMKVTKVCCNYRTEEVQS